jgi:hypothetical protein
MDSPRSPLERIVRLGGGCYEASAARRAREPGQAWLPIVHRKRRARNDEGDRLLRSGRPTPAARRKLSDRGAAHPPTGWRGRDDCDTRPAADS